MEQVSWGCSDGASELEILRWSKKDKNTVMEQVSWRCSGGARKTVMEQVIQGWNDRASKPGRKEIKVPWAQDFSPAWDVNGLVTQKAAAKAETSQSSWCNCGISTFSQA